MHKFIMNSPISKAVKGTWILFIAVVLSGVITCSAQQQQTDKPNIIFILTDDLGFGDLGVLFQKQRAKANDKSEPWMFTPNLDALAAGGALLPNHYCAAPVCAPSRASILLGVSQGHANVRDNQFDKALSVRRHADKLASVARVRRGGYQTPGT